MSGPQGFTGLLSAMTETENSKKRLEVAEQQGATVKCVDPVFTVTDSWVDPRCGLLEKENSTTNGFRPVKNIKARTLFASYCISHDQRWVVVGVSDSTGSLIDSNVSYYLKVCSNFHQNLNFQGYFYRYRPQFPPLSKNNHAQIRD